MSVLMDRFVRDGIWPPQPAPRGGWTEQRLYDAIVADWLESEDAERRLAAALHNTIPVKNGPGPFGWDGDDARAILEELRKP